MDFVKLTQIRSMTTVTSKHIEVTPGVCGGRSRIAGHRIRVQDVVVWHEQKGMKSCLDIQLLLWRMFMQLWLTTTIISTKSDGKCKRMKIW